MKFKQINILFTLATFLMAACVWAQIPAPPVNQSIGLPDTVFKNLTEPDCRECHSQTPPANVPIDPSYLPDRHHLLVDQPIPSAGGGTYECTTCHTMTFNGTSWEMDQNFRDCLQCHEDSPHHTTANAQSGNCTACHGGVLSNMDDGHYVPTYSPSLITPWPSDKANGDSNTVNSVGVEAGNCNFCHNTANPDGSPSVDPVSGVLVGNNQETHHGTGFIDDSSKCVWCHDFNSTPAESIRQCQGCHSVATLHNIQTNSSGDTIDVITPGQEEAGYGHIGAQSDCTGCHGFASGASIGPAPTGAIIPSVDTISVSSIVAGSKTKIVINGSGFVNLVQNPQTGTYDFELSSEVLLTDADGNLTTISPESVTGNTIEAFIPDTLAAGTYQIAAVKGDVAKGNFNASNPLKLTITPKAVIDSVRWRIRGDVIITGSNFREYLKAVDSGTAVTGTVESGTVTGEVVSWTDTKIVAKFPSRPSSVEVNTVFGSASSRIKRFRR